MTVVGPAGIGKSRLARDFVDTLGGAATVVAGRCLSYGEGLTFWPLREVVQELAGSDDGESSEQAQAEIARLLPANDDTATIVERVAGALGLSDVAASPQETFWAVRKLLEAAAGQAPARGPLRGHPLGGAHVPRADRAPGGDDPRASRS